MDVTLTAAQRSALLHLEPGYETSGWGLNYSAAVESLGRWRPDLVTLEWKRADRLGHKRMARTAKLTDAGVTLRARLIAEDTP